MVASVFIGGALLAVLAALVGHEVGARRARGQASRELAAAEERMAELEAARAELAARDRVVSAEGERWRCAASDLEASLADTTQEKTRLDYELRQVGLAASRVPQLEQNVFELARAQASLVEAGRRLDELESVAAELALREQYVESLQRELTHRDERVLALEHRLGELTALTALPLADVAVVGPDAAEPAQLLPAGAMVAARSRPQLAGRPEFAAGPGTIAGPGGAPPALADSAHTAAASVDGVAQLHGPLLGRSVTADAGQAVRSGRPVRADGGHPRHRSALEPAALGSRAPLTHPPPDEGSSPDNRSADLAVEGEPLVDRPAVVPAGTGPPPARTPAPVPTSTSASTLTPAPGPAVADSDPTEPEELVEPERASTAPVGRALQQALEGLGVQSFADLGVFDPAQGERG